MSDIEVRKTIVEILRRTMYPTKSGDYKSEAKAALTAIKGIINNQRKD